MLPTSPIDPQLALLLAAVVLDALLGDPDYPLHPIRLLGHASIALERRLFARGWDGRLAGALHGLAVTLGALGAWWLGHALLVALHPLLGWLWDLFVAYSLLCTRDLLAHGRRVLLVLDDLPAARERLRWLVSRDTAGLDRGGVVRATIESLSENLTDGVLTPLWALALFGLPGLVVVKAVSSLDSMVGYRNARYGRFGWAAARTDDIMHWLPARLSVPLLAAAAALLGRHWRAVLPAARRWHAVLPSPNSGWSEAAAAGALRVRLAGPGRYHGEEIHRPWIGADAWPADLDGGDLRRALWLVGLAAGLASLIAAGLCLAA
ncbi:MAG: adenosylcobinamide-phosphate synthase CbiB [Thiohalocapsa sp.]|uniref:adenosylcobinamide-phosphate synthase CbiB n=1 Tax=Thiohalocapsa sp. TaxID=2497641 RepID=UPI0025FC112D|nr:adenosylcobinamide-phosphate synthase CbiB [Thiohalocapsa sp.]MCG6941947.1 adenosylcobinamide-phosphate synthase CbiB [Thiohalocapsa sp.]